MDILSDVNVSGKVVANSLNTNHINNCNAGHLDIHSDMDMTIGANYLNFYITKLHICGGGDVDFSNACAVFKTIFTDTITINDKTSTIDIPADCTRFLIKEYQSICGEEQFKYPIVSAYSGYKKVDIDVEISFADSTEKIIGEITASSNPMTLKVSVFQNNLI